MAKVEFIVSKETKFKRRWAFWVVSILLIISLVLLSLPFVNKDISIAMTTGLCLLFIGMIINWILESKIKKLPKEKKINEKTRAYIFWGLYFLLVICVYGFLFWAEWKFGHTPFNIFGELA